MVICKKVEKANVNKEKNEAILRLYEKMDQMQDLMSKLTNQLLNKDK